MYPASSVHSALGAASSNYEGGKDATSPNYKANSRGHLEYLVESKGPHKQSCATLPLR